MAAALAIWLALPKELSEINIAFFDEPTTNMDEERRRNLLSKSGGSRISISSSSSSTTTALKALQIRLYVGRVELITEIEQYLQRLRFVPIHRCYITHLGISLYT